MEEKILREKDHGADMLVWVRLHGLMSLLTRFRWLKFLKYVNKNILGVL